MLTLLLGINLLIPTRSLKEYYQDNKEYYQEYKKEWYQDNKEQLKEKFKEYYQYNKEQIKDKSKEYNKKYYQDNKEQCKEKRKEYYQNNKEQIKEQCKEKYTCDCGSIIQKDSKSKHLKSDKHNDYITNLKDNSDFHQSCNLESYC